MMNIYQIQCIILLSHRCSQCKLLLHLDPFSAHSAIGILHSCHLLCPSAQRAPCAIRLHFSALPYKTLQKEKNLSLIPALASCEIKCHSNEPKYLKGLFISTKSFVTREQISSTHFWPIESLYILSFKTDSIMSQHIGSTDSGKNVTFRGTQARVKSNFHQSIISSSESYPQSNSPHLTSHPFFEYRLCFR